MVSPKSKASKEAAAPTVQPKIRMSTSAKDNQPSDDDVEMEELPEAAGDGISTQLQIRPMVINNKRPAVIDGYRDIWERGEFNKQTQVIGDYEPTRDKFHVVIPIPRAQPIEYLNKFARTQLPIAEPHFQKLKPQP